MKSQSWNGVNQLVVDPRFVDALLLTGPHHSPVLRLGPQAHSVQLHSTGALQVLLPARLQLLGRRLLNVGDLLLALLGLHHQTMLQRGPDVLLSQRSNVLLDHNRLNVDELLSVLLPLDELPTLLLVVQEAPSLDELLCALRLRSVLLFASLFHGVFALLHLSDRPTAHQCSDVVP